MATLLHKNLGNKNPFEIQVWYKQTKQMKRSISFVIFLWKKMDSIVTEELASIQH